MGAATVAAAAVAPAAVGVIKRALERFAISLAYRRAGSDSDRRARGVLRSLTLPARLCAIRLQTAINERAAGRYPTTG